ncbi:hypothetical protein EYC80_000577 [Monilinia laxa]|uniref:Uncharacterized protein n=1 Tax=Monilinia laxa TaxID=61186 RepID=A0A5N6KC92_MONLA|nr:hypothetical protein EYC80_000577 [Monilinia laxa]
MSNIWMMGKCMAWYDTIRHEDGFTLAFSGSLVASLGWIPLLTYLVLTRMGWRDWWSMKYRVSCGSVGLYRYIPYKIKSNQIKRDYLSHYIISHYISSG